MILLKAQPRTELRKQLWDNVKFFKTGLEKMNIDTAPSETQIIPVLTGDNQKTLEISQRLLDEGVFIQAIRPPTVPVGQARLRITIMATHNRKDLEYALEKVGEALR